MGNVSQRSRNGSTGLRLRDPMNPRFTNSGRRQRTHGASIEPRRGIMRIDQHFSSELFFAAHKSHRYQ